MRYRTLPNTELEVSAIGLGTYALAGVYGRVDWVDVRQTIHRALDLGVTFFDTAPAYGRAEEQLGLLLKGQRERVVISTKVGSGEGNQRDLSYAAVLRQCDESLKRLHTDRIDLYYIHFDDPDTPVEETLAALEVLKRRGKLREYGVSHLPADRVAEYIRAGSPASFMVELSPVARNGYHALLAHGAREGIVAFSPTGRGMLTGRFSRETSFPPGDLRRVDPLFQRDRFRSALRVAERFREAAEGLGVSTVQLALAWVLSRRGVSSALVGTMNPTHLEENAAASELEVPEALLEELDSFLVEEKQRYRREHHATLEHLLFGDASGHTVADAIYTIESLVELGIVGEKEVMPVFMEVWSLRNAENPEPDTIKRVFVRLHEFYCSSKPPGEKE